MGDQQEDFNVGVDVKKKGVPVYTTNGQLKKGIRGTIWRPGGRNRFSEDEDSEGSRDFDDLREQRSRDEGKRGDRRIPNRRKREDRPRSKRTKKDEDRETKWTQKNAYTTAASFVDLKSFQWELLHGTPGVWS